MNSLTWKAFSSHSVRRVSLGLVCLLLLGSGYGVWWAFSNPTEVEEQVTLLSYQHKGEFDHQVYAKPGILGSLAAEEEPNPVYFTKIIESADVAFSYKFMFEEPLTQVTERVKISAVLEKPGLWQYEVILVPETNKTGDFTISFPLEAAQFQELAFQIGEEIGIRAASPDITLKATVHTQAQTELGVLESDFVQAAKVKLTATMIEWDRDLAFSQQGLYHQLRYEHQGIFDYTLKLGPSILYGESTTIKSNTPPPEPPAAIAHSPSYATADIGSMDVVFSYQFKPGEKVEQVSEEVEVKAVLQDPENWSETFVLVPNRKEAGDFSVSFPLDLAHFHEVIEAKQREMRVLAPSHDLILEAKVHTIAPSKFGSIDEVFSQSLNLSLSETTVEWTEDVTKSQSGSIMKSVIVPRPEVEAARKWSLAALGVMVLAFLYVLWNYIQVKPARLSAITAEFLRASKKYKNVIVDVEELPEAKDGETIIQLTSLDGLIKTADNSLKPVLHKEYRLSHTYRVIDGSTMYEYVAEA